MEAKANPVVENNEITENQSGGLRVAFESTGHVRENQIHNNRTFGLTADTNSVPVVVRNKINNCQGRPRLLAPRHLPLPFP